MPKEKLAMRQDFIDLAGQQKSCHAAKIWGSLQESRSVAEDKDSRILQALTHVICIHNGFNHSGNKIHGVKEEKRMRKLAILKAW